MSRTLEGRPREASDPGFKPLSKSEVQKKCESMVRGALMGSSSTFVAHPLDTVKATMQAQWGRDSLDMTLGDTLGRILRDKGLAGLFRGVWGGMTGAAAAVAARMLVYDSVLAHRELLLPAGAPPGVAHLLAGALGEVCGVLVRAPSELVKQRLQVGRMQGTAGAATWHILASEGPPGLYRGVGAMMLRDVPQTALNFAIYEGIKRSRVLDRAARWVSRQVALGRGRRQPDAAAALPLSPAAGAEGGRPMVESPGLVTRDSGRDGNGAVLRSSGMAAPPASAAQGFTTGEGNRGRGGAGPCRVGGHESRGGGDMRGQSTLSASERGRDGDEDADVSGDGHVAAWQSLVAGGLSGAASAFLTTPFDVIKTKVMTSMASGAAAEAAAHAAAPNGASTAAAAGNGVVSAGAAAVAHGAKAFGSSSVAARAAAANAVQGTGRRLLRRGPAALASNAAVAAGGPAAGAGLARMGTVAAARRILAEQGWRGFFAGAVPRTLLMVPDVAVMMLVYELSSRLIKQVPPLELRLPGPFPARQAHVPDREWKG